MENITIIAASSHNHFTTDNVQVKDRTVISDTGFELKHVEHEPLTFETGVWVNRRVIEKDVFGDKIREIRD